MQRSSKAELAGRIEAAAKLLAEGLPRPEAVSVLATRFSVDRRTARRYVTAGAELIAEECEPLDLLRDLAESRQRLQSIAAQARSAGNLTAAIQAERVISHQLTQIYRADNTAAAVLSGKTIAMPEQQQQQPTDRQQRKHRRSIRDLPPDLGF